MTTKKKNPNREPSSVEEVLSEKEWHKKPEHLKDVKNTVINRIMQIAEEKGYTPEQAMGIAGTLYGENDSFNPDRWQTENKFGEGGIKGMKHAYGLAQWEEPRRSELKNFAHITNQDPAAVETQLQFVFHELRNKEKLAGKMLKKAGTPEEAARVLTRHYERPRTSLKAHQNIEPLTGKTPDALNPEMPLGDQRDMITRKRLEEHEALPKYLEKYAEPVETDFDSDEEIHRGNIAKEFFDEYIKRMK